MIASDLELLLIFLAGMLCSLMWIWTVMPSYTGDNNFRHGVNLQLLEYDPVNEDECENCPCAYEGEQWRPC